MRIRRPLGDQIVLRTITALIVVCIAAFPVGAAFAQDLFEADAVGGAACEPVTADPLSGCIATDGTRNVVIGPGPGREKCIKVFVDKSYTGTNALGTIQIKEKGFLFVPDTTLEIETKGIEVQELFQVGTATCPIGTANPANTVTIRFTGGRPTSGGEDHTKGIVVHDGARLRLYGAKGVPGGALNGISWTHLKEAAGPAAYGKDSGAKRPVPTGGDKTLQLAKDVTTGNGAWKKGDWIVVATTSFSPFESEFVQIDPGKDPTSDGKGGSIVTLNANTPLKHYHFGGPDPGQPSAANFDGDKADKDHNYGVDERAEVGLISRNIKLTATIESGDTNKHWGGEIRILKGFKEVGIQGVEIEKFGKDEIGAYPIHFHLDEDVKATPPLVNANSVHHSYNKCVTIHSTQNMTVQNMVCARIVGHIFYQEFGNESGISFLNNLGLGAMSHYFDIAAGTSADRKAQFWGGDYLANAAGFGYDGFKVPNTDDQENPTRGTCAVVGDTGELATKADRNPFTPEQGNTSCASGQIYYEPASGFWIIDPSTVLEGNSIGGCQGAGRGYWYVPPKNRPETGVPPALTTVQNKALGSFKNNRVHGCYSGVYAEPEFGLFSEQLFPRDTGDTNGKNLIATFNGLTATRIRDRGIWIRPMWSVVQNGRFATNKASVILVSSGGLDGNAPGVWALLKDSVLVGMSENNVDRWGPCPVNTAKGVGCVDLTTAANDIVGDGYPLPAFSLFGYQIYDGPVRIFHNHFVNFNSDVTPHLTESDKTFLSTYTAYQGGSLKVTKTRYEGDAALAWFKSNQSAYPNATISKQLTFTNVTLRHEIFTDEVNYGTFDDGDRNTVLIDGDGSLTGFEVVRSADSKKVPGADPVSLNNLGYNHAANSVDECLAEGQQDTDTEARPTSLITPLGVATLEFGGNFPPSLPPPPPPVVGPNPAQPATKQRLTFTKDYKEFCLDTAHPELCQHQSSQLTSRNTLGIWEPKVVSGYGYTVAASKCANPPACTTGDAGIPARVSVGLTDAVKPVISKDDPFFVRLGICYTNSDGTTHPAGNFTITRGYHSWGGAGTNFNLLDVRKFFNKLNNLYPKVQLPDHGDICENLDIQTCVSPTKCENLDPERGCPAHGIALKSAQTGSKCPDGTTEDKDRDSQDVCVYPKTELKPLTCSKTPKECVAELTHDTFYYDQKSGLLFFYVVQDAPNAFGPSPVVTCTDTSGDPCPDVKNGESYYACPPQGCIDYVVRLNDSNYKPGPSNCPAYPTFETPEPDPKFKLVLKGTITPVVFVQKGGKDNKFPHYEATTAPVCPTTSP